MSVIVGTIVFRSSTSNNSAFSVCSKCAMCTCFVSTPSDHAYHTYYLHMHNCSIVLSFVSSIRRQRTATATFCVCPQEEVTIGF